MIRSLAFKFISQIRGFFLSFGYSLGGINYQYVLFSSSLEPLSFFSDLHLSAIFRHLLTVANNISCAEVYSAAVSEIYVRRTRVVILGGGDNSQMQLLILLGKGPMWEASG